MFSFRCRQIALLFEPPFQLVDLCLREEYPTPPALAERRRERADGRRRAGRGHGGDGGVTRLGLRDVEGGTESHAVDMAVDGGSRHRDSRETGWTGAG